MAHRLVDSAPGCPTWSAMEKFQKWPKIRQFKDAEYARRNRYVRAWMDSVGLTDEVAYRAKVKLHGTQAGVRVDGGAVTAQSKGRELSVNSDNYGFAAWVAGRADGWSLVTAPSGEPTEFVTVYGEWCGPGIQVNVAASRTPERFFAAFGARVGDRFIVEPDELAVILSPLSGDDAVHVIPWQGPELVLGADVDGFAATVTAMVDAVCAEDPLILEWYKVRGPGEGVVMYPVGVPATDHWYDLAFKAKGEDFYEVSSQKKTPMTRVAISYDGAEELVRDYLTPHRFDKAVAEVVGTEPVSRRHLGAIIRWLQADVTAEAATEIAEQGIHAKAVHTFVATVAKEMVMAAEAAPPPA